MKNFKKLFASVAIVAMLASTVPTAVLGAASYSDELEGAYDYAATNGITSASSIDNANMYGSLTRVAMAKMMANYAIEVLGLTPDTSKDCSFTDVSAALDAQYDNGVTNACQLGLMGVGITEFNPNGLVNRAQFGTVLSRAMYGDENNDGDPYYVNHLNALKDAGIMNNISNPNALEVRGYVMLMMQRADEGTTTPAICETPENVLSCSLGLDTCPAECVTVENDVTAMGDVAVSLSSLDKTTVPSNVPGAQIGKLKFKAGNSDAKLVSLKLQAAGFGNYRNLTSVYLEDENGARVTRQRNVDSDGNLTLDFVSDYTLKANSTAIFTLATTIVGGANGDTYGFEVKSLTGPENVDGLPLSTALVSQVTIANLGKLAITSNVATVNPKIGKEEKLGSFKIAAAGSSDEDVKMYSLIVKQDGDMSMSNLKDLNLTINGEVVSASTTAIDGKYVTFTFKNGGYLIAKDRTSTLTVNLMGTIAGDPSKHVQFIIDKVEDFVAKGTKQGYRVIVDNLTAGYTLSNSLMIESSEITASFDKTIDTNTLKTINGFNFGTLKLNSINTSYELESYKIRLTTAIDYATVAALENVVKNVRLGWKLPESIVRTAPNTFEYNFDYISINKGTPRNLALTMDLKDAAATQTFNWDLSLLNNKFKLVDLDADKSYVLAADVSNIFSTTSMSTRTVTVDAASLALTVVPMVNNSVVVGNGNTLVVAKGRLEAGNTSDAKITNFKITNTPGVANLNTFVSSAKLIVDGVSYNHTAIGTTTIDFDREFVISKGASNRKDFQVVLTLKKGDVALLNSLNFKVNVAGDLVAEDLEGKSITPTVATASFGTFTLTDKGTVTMDIDTLTDGATVYTQFINKDKYVVAGAKGVTLAKVKVFADKEDAKIKDIAFNVVTNNADNLIASLNDVRLVNSWSSYAATITKVDATNVKVAFADANTIVTMGASRNLYLVADYNAIDPKGTTSTTVAGTTAQVTDIIAATRIIGNESSNDLTFNIATNETDSKTTTVVANVPATITIAGGANGDITTAGNYKIATLNITTDAQSVNKDAVGELLKAKLSSLKLNVGVSAGALATYTIKKVGGAVAPVALTADGVVVNDVSTLGVDGDIQNNGTTFEIWATVTNVGTRADGAVFQTQIANIASDIVLTDGTSATTKANLADGVATNLTVSSK